MILTCRLNWASHTDMVFSQTLQAEFKSCLHCSKNTKLGPLFGSKHLHVTFSQWLNLSTESNKILRVPRRWTSNVLNTYLIRKKMKKKEQEKQPVGKHSCALFVRHMSKRKMRWHGSEEQSLWTDAVAPQWLTCLLPRWDGYATQWVKGFMGDRVCFHNFNTAPTKNDSILSICSTHIPRPQCTQTRHTTHWTQSKIEWLIHTAHSK